MNNNYHSVRYHHLKVYSQLQKFDGKEPDLVFAFFAIFSRFEFALKASIKYCVEGRNSSATPNWNLFASDIESIINPDKTAELREAFDYYINRPPRIQVFNGNRLIWKDNKKPSDKTDFSWVLSSIRVVRNNLFHGGKFPFNQYRDTQLLDHGLVILNECLELDNDLGSIFRATSTLD